MISPKQQPYVIIRRLNRMVITALIAMLAMGGGAVANAQSGVAFDPESFSVQLSPVAEGFSRPVQVLESPDTSGRLFVVEQTGTVRILQDGVTLPDPFLDITDLVSDSNEQGLLSIAFHPDFAENQIFFIDFTDLDGNTLVERWTVDPDDVNRADPDSAQLVLGVDQPAPNHNGGLLLFGPDGFLYIGLGDGGSQGDPDGNGQNTNTLLGAILRIDVDTTSGDLAYGTPADNPFADGADGRPEIWIYGLRNPWRFSFDRATGDLYVGDVGQGNYEEVTLFPAGSNERNFGWNIMEGETCYLTEDCDSTGLTMPFFVYSHDEGGCSVVGGYVYRGEEFSALQGVYLTADYCTGQLWGVGQNDDGEWVASAPVQTELNISSFGEDNAGNIYLTDLNGGVWKIEQP